MDSELRDKNRSALAARNEARNRERQPGLAAVGQKISFNANWICRDG
jgi:hypothetical protein